MQGVEVHTESQKEVHPERNTHDGRRCPRLLLSCGAQQYVAVSIVWIMQANVWQLES
jgi:hypothetical protein